MILSVTGKQLDGIWHTAVVVYGQEFFFGGNGIQSCDPVSVWLFLMMYKYYSYLDRGWRGMFRLKQLKNIVIACQSNIFECGAMGIVHIHRHTYIQIYMLELNLSHNTIAVGICTLGTCIVFPQIMLNHIRPNW